MTLMIEHAGVKGMRWGVRKARLTLTEYAKSSVKSKAREYSWGKKVANVKKSSMRQLQKDVTRLQLENQLKKNSRGILALDKKKVYRNRAKLSDQNLKRIVKRYQLEATLKKEFKSITSADRKKARKVIKTAGEIYLKTAVPPAAALPAP